MNDHPAPVPSLNKKMFLRFFFVILSLPLLIGCHQKQAEYNTVLQQRVSPPALAGKQKICLNMIVKNESSVIRRCLDSVKPYIDYWIIVDTGSTDGTQEIIKDHLKDIPGELHERPWKNFGYNRTEAVNLAKGKGDYLLFLDADDWLTFEPEFKFPPLVHDLYNVWRGTDDHSYIKAELAKADLPWKWIGVWHEYLSCDRPYSSGFLEKVRYISGDGGATSKDPEKFLKAAKTLEEGLKDEPNNNRYAFYLAESYREAGLKEKALEAHQKHTRMNGWDEEIFWSLLQIAHLQRDLDFSMDTVIESFNKAHRFRPHRPEPIYFLAEIYNQQNKFELAYECIKGKTFIPKHSKDAIFNLDWIEKYGFLMQLSICTYYLGYYQESAAACDAILACKNLPENWRSQASANRTFALAKLQENSSPRAEAELKIEGKHSEEAFFALLQVARIQEDHKLPPEIVIAGYNNAFKYLPSRIEPLYFLSCYYRKLERYEDAYQTAQKGLKISMPPSNQAYRWMYDYGMLWEFSMCASSTGRFEEAVEASLKLLDNPYMSEDSRKVIKKNLTYFNPGVQIMSFARNKWGAPPWKRTGKRGTPTGLYSPQPPKNPRLHVCAEASHQTPQLQQLLESCKAHHIKLDVLGLGEPFSFGKRLKDYKKYLETLPEDDIVLFIDAYDTLVLANEKTILDKFFAMNAPFVVSVEVNCHPFPHLSAHYPPSPTKFKYVNAGSYIGYAGTIKRIYDDISPIPDETDDQGLLSVYFLYHPHTFKLDYSCDLFLTLLQVEKDQLILDVNKKNVQSLITSTEPCVIHGNSLGRGLYQQIYDTVFKQQEPQAAQ